jgi:transposase InsO family protein
MVVRKYLGAFKGMCTSYGIAHSTTTPYTPELNGKAERYYWRTVVGTASAFLKYDGDLPLSLWPFAVAYAASFRLLHTPVVHLDSYT